MTRVSTEKKFRILHLSSVRELSSGQRKQLKFEVDGSEKIGNVDWETLALHTKETVYSFERRIPLLFRPLLLRNLFAWLVVIKIKKNYDVVLLRHITFDPFVFIFSPFVPNRVSVHHAKEVAELRLIRRGLIGNFASNLEKITGRFAIKNAAGILGVTKEIAKYEKDLVGDDKPFHVYPNGINLNTVDIADDLRINDSVEIVFICGSFSPWHGLDRLLSAADAYEAKEGAPSINIHLIGRVPEDLLNEIKNTEKRSKLFNVHGPLVGSEYKDLISKSDVGIGSLAMDRQNLKEGATLKVRELLAMGIPVYSGHTDTALPPDFKYYKVKEFPSLEGISEMALDMKGTSRSAVRESARRFIDKSASMRGVVVWSKSILNEPQ